MDKNSEMIIEVKINDIKKRIGLKLAKVRELCGYSQSEVVTLFSSNGIRINQRTISGFENGERKISLEILYGYLYYLQVNPYWLFWNEKADHITNEETVTNILLRIIIAIMGLQKIDENVEQSERPKTDKNIEQYTKLVTAVRGKKIKLTPDAKGNIVIFRYEGSTIGSINESENEEIENILKIIDSLQSDMEKLKNRVLELKKK